jgi:hypothetical protein
MTEYGVMHRCRWLVRLIGPSRQCVRRGRWLKAQQFWLCHQHYVCANGMEEAQIRKHIAFGAWVQERLFP